MGTRFNKSTLVDDLLPHGARCRSSNLDYAVRDWSQLLMDWSADIGSQCSVSTHRTTAIPFRFSHPLPEARFHS